MSVFRTSQIEWKGKAYDVTPSMSLLSKIEQSGKSLVGIANMAAKGSPQIALMSEVMGLVMRSAGVSVTDEEIYGEAMSGSPTEVLELWNSIFVMISPMNKKEKKPDAPEVE